jgi:GT2 family glycosyltransferase
LALPLKVRQGKLAARKLRGVYPEAAGAVEWADRSSENRPPNMVSVLITTYNSAGVLEACLKSIFEQDYPNVEVIVVDNASSDGTRELLERIGHGLRVFYNEINTGFAAAQNQAMAEARGDWLLSLNPDVILSRDFIPKLVAAGETDPRAGSVCGKLLRWRPGEASERTQIIDSTGIYFLRNLRHLDRGADELDRGQYEQLEYVIGATGAAALYRRKMVEDVSVDGEFFDEDFFAYREDADVAWRAQLLGWRCLYTPQAVAWHVRRVTPERFKDLPDLINRHSIKNRFLMRAKNLSWPMYLRLFGPITLRDILIFGDCLLFRPQLLSGLKVLWTQRDAIRKKREWIQSRRRIADAEMVKWFSNRPRSYAAGAGAAQSSGNARGIPRATI